MSKLPHTISSQSRKKLKISEFQQPGNSHTGNDDKENTRVAPKLQGKNALVEGVSQKEPSTSKCPQTPGNKDRLDFEDLIANPEDAFNKEIIATPNDQVEWRNGPGSSVPSSAVMPSQKSRKRVRNSSPSSSQPMTRSKHFYTDKDALDLESISRSLRTPKQEDPLMALWDRYADSHERGEHVEPILPPMPPLSSSPNTPGTHRKGDGIRRTASCGVEWPMSATKRRKLSDKDPYSRARGIFAASKSAILGRDYSKSSRVSVLVDSIHQSLLHKVIPEEEAPASSSPMPQQYENRDDTTNDLVPPGDFAREQPVGCDVIEPDEHEVSSEFGDVDFDLDDPDFLDALDEAATQPAPSNIVNTHIADAKSASIQPVVEQPTEVLLGKRSISSDQDKSHAARAYSSLNEQSPSIRKDVLPKHTGSEHSSKDSFGEFDDEDEDFATELAELADKVESQDVTARARDLVVDDKSRGSTKSASQAEFDDAFDDDDDELWKEIDHEVVRPTAPVVGSTTQVRRLPDL